MIHLSNILECSAFGRKMIEIHKRRENLNEDQQKIFMEEIVGFYLRNDIKMTSSEAIRLDGEVKLYYPSEEIVN